MKLSPYHNPIPCSYRAEMCMTAPLSNDPALDLFVYGYIVTFRSYCKEDYFVKIHGFRSLFPCGESESLILLFSELSSHGFYFSFEV